MRRILSAPCSYGAEPLSLADRCLRLRIEFSIDAFDLQPELIAQGRAGVLFPLSEHLFVTPAIVAPSVLEKINYEVRDLLRPDEPAGEPWDLVVCSHFLQYFSTEVAAEVALKIARKTKPDGLFVLDYMSLRVYPAIAETLKADGFTRRSSVCFSRSWKPS